MLQVDFVCVDGRRPRVSDSVRVDSEDEAWDDQVLTRPSVSVVEWKVKADGSSREGRGEWRVRVQDRPEAGLPVKVLRTWQVMGSRAIVVLSVEVCIIVEKVS